MRFVIQNYLTLSRKFAVNPRLRSLILLNNLIFFFFYYKNTYLFNWSNLYNLFSFNFFSILYKFFFFKQLFFFFRKMTLTFTGFYLNNLIKSSVFLFFKGLSLFFNNQFLPFSGAVFLAATASRPKLLFNIIFLPVKALNVNLTKTFFKNSFFFFLFFSSTLWYQHTNFLSFYLTFLLVNWNYKVTPLFGDFFLPVFNL